MLRKKRKPTPEEIIATVARRAHVSVEEVRFSITQAIRMGMMNPDPKVREKWNQFPIKDRMPTPEEFIFHAPNFFDFINIDVRNSK